MASVLILAHLRFCFTESLGAAELGQELGSILAEHRLIHSPVVPHEIRSGSLERSHARPPSPGCQIVN
jgi:hypothetical protein